jgi:hypothetical protein
MKRSYAKGGKSQTISVLLFTLLFLVTGVDRSLNAQSSTYVRLGGDFEFYNLQVNGSWVYFGGSVGFHTKVFKKFSAGVGINYMYSPPVRNRGVVFGVTRISLDGEFQYNFSELGNGLFVGTSLYIGQEIWYFKEDNIKSTNSPVFVMRVYGGKNIKITDHFSLGFRLGGGPQIGEVGYSIQTSLYGLYRF